MKYLILTFLLTVSLTSCEIEGTSGSSGGISGCPTTSACGCSGHNKSDCEDDSCSKWTVGEGCDCR